MRTFYKLPHSTSPCPDSRPWAAYSLGTGQIHEALAPMHEVSGVLNCLHDLEWVLITNHTTTPERNKPNANNTNPPKWNKTNANI